LQEREEREQRGERREKRHRTEIRGEKRREEKSREEKEKDERRGEFIFLAGTIKLEPKCVHTYPQKVVAN
jgi:hypothetical protein